MLALSDIRLATLADAPAIARMSRDCIEHGLSWSWTFGRVAQAVHDPDTNVAVALRRGQLQGFAIMQYLDDTAHLVLLAVRPEMRHQGQGRQLLGWLERAAQVAGNMVIRLECRADNRNAIAFYRRLGYHETGRVAGYYEGRVDGVQLARQWPADRASPRSENDDGAVQEPTLPSRKFTVSRPSALGARRRGMGHG